MDGKLIIAINPVCSCGRLKSTSARFHTEDCAKSTLINESVVKTKSQIPKNERETETRLPKSP